MEIKLLRKEKTPEHTLGSMYYDDGFFGYTIEPPHITLAGVNDVSALPEGTYTIAVKNNPLAGTPCLKLIGVSVPANASIRSCNPSNRKNPSITLISSPTGKGDASVIDAGAWAKLLDFVVKNKTVSLVII